MKFIEDLKIKIDERQANESKLTQKLEAYNQLKQELKEVQDRFAATLEEKLLEEMRGLKLKLEALGSDVEAISQGLKKEFRISTENNIEQELDNLSSALKIKERKVKVNKAMNAYAGAIKEYEAAYNELTKVSIELSRMQKHVDVEALERFKAWHEENEDLQTTDIRRSHAAYNFDKLMDAAFPTWTQLNKLILNMDGKH